MIADVIGDELPEACFASQSSSHGPSRKRGWAENEMKPNPPSFYFVDPGVKRLLVRGKSKMSSLRATMRKLVHLCFGVLKTQQPYQHDYLKNA